MPLFDNSNISYHLTLILIHGRGRVGSRHRVTRQVGRDGSGGVVYMLLHLQIYVVSRVKVEPLSLIGAVSSHGGGTKAVARRRQLPKETTGK